MQYTRLPSQATNNMLLLIFSKTWFYTPPNVLLKHSAICIKCMFPVHAQTAKSAILSMIAKTGDHIVHCLLMALHYHGSSKITPVSNFFLWYHDSSKNTLNKCSIRSDTLTVQFQGNKQSPTYWTQRTGYGTTRIWTGHMDAANGTLSTHIRDGEEAALRSLWPTVHVAHSAVLSRVDWWP